MAYKGVSIKSREKTIVRVFDRVQEKLQLCGMFFFFVCLFFQENGDEDLVLSSFSHCKLEYIGSTYFTVYFNFIMFSSKQEKPNDTLLPFYIFVNAMHLNLKAEGRFDMSN